MLIAERFIGGLVKNHGNHPVSTDGGTWYPQACRFLGLEHHLHSSFEKSIIERTMQYIKDRTENFDDYFPCRIKNCKLKHVRNWLRFFVDYHNKEIKPVKWTEPNLLRLIQIRSEQLKILFCWTQRYSSSWWSRTDNHYIILMLLHLGITWYLNTQQQEFKFQRLCRKTLIFVDDNNNVNRHIRGD